MAIITIGLISEPVVNRRPEVLMNQHTASAFMTNFTLLRCRTARMTGIAMASPESAGVGIGVIINESATVTFRA
jgi:hypothetical protein